jgi:hypothetical protein
MGILLAGASGALVAVGLFLLSTNAPFFSPRTYVDANEWFGLSIIGDIELVFASHAAIFGVAYLTSKDLRTFLFTVAGFCLSSLIMAAAAFVYRPAPHSLFTTAQTKAIALWILLSVFFGFAGRAWGAMSRPRRPPNLTTPDHPEGPRNPENMSSVQ